MPRLRILFVVSECAPIVKTGGLGDVAAALPVELARRGHDVRVLMPRYRAAKRHAATRLPAPLAAALGQVERWSAVWQGQLAPRVPLYLLEHDALYDRDGVYGDESGAFADNPARFALLSRAGLALSGYLPFEADVVHVHDWQTALLPVYLAASGRAGATVLTIHNLGYQGCFDASQLAATGLSREDHLRLGVEHFGALNLLKGGLCCATCLSTVSPTYAAEIKTPEGGAGLDGVLRSRAADLVGILNGIDERTWDPRTDRLLPARYDESDLSGKAECKRALQAELGLPQRADVPLVGMVSRFVGQKGIEVFATALEELLPLDLQFALLGAGERWAEELLGRLSSTTSNLRARFGIDERLAHLIEAGSDLFAMPSRYEPCGLNQMYSQRYGTLPVVRAVGGLTDTVKHDETGFVFEAFDGHALARAVAYAADTCRQRPRHFAAMQRASMLKSMGWDRAACQYEALYRLAIARAAGRH